MSSQVVVLGVGRCLACVGRGDQSWSERSVDGADATLEVGGREGNRASDRSSDCHQCMNMHDTCSSTLVKGGAALLMLSRHDRLS